MTYDPHQNPEQQRGIEYPPLESSGNAYGAVEYPPNVQLPPPLPPPVYPPTYPTYPSGYPTPYQGYSADPYDPYRAGRPAGTNGMAIGALVCSLVGPFFCGLPSIAGLILGIIAMQETKRTGQDGHGLALAGVIIGAVGLPLLLLFFIAAVAADASTSAAALSLVG